MTLLGAAATWPSVARAQQPAPVRRIAALMPFAEGAGEGHAVLEAFRQGLNDLGWAEDRNIRIDARWGAGNVEPPHGANAGPRRSPHTACPC